MSRNFPDQIKDVEDHRIVGMTTYPLDEVLLTVLTGALCRGEDFDEIEIICAEHRPWLRRFLPLRHGIAPAQIRTAKRVACQNGLQSMQRFADRSRTSMRHPDQSEI